MDGVDAGQARPPPPAPSTVNNKSSTMAIFVFWPYFAPEKTPLFTKVKLDNLGTLWHNCKNENTCY